MDLISKIEQTKDFLRQKTDTIPETAIILESELGSLADKIENPINIDYHDIPNFSFSTEKSHIGSLVFGKLKGKDVLVMNGRFHYYEGYGLEEVTFPIRVIKSLGVEKLIVTNAAGAVNADYCKGDLMIIEDHINFSFRNPLIGINYEELGNRFPDMSKAYDSDLIEKAVQAAREKDIVVKKGIYAWVTGPSYETPAELRALSRLGVDAVGMSTVPEVLIARHGNLNVLGISCITNKTTEELDEPLKHRDIGESSEETREKFIDLLVGIIEKI